MLLQKASDTFINNKVDEMKLTKKQSGGQVYFAAENVANLFT